MKLVFATNNKYKFEEIRDILTKKIELLSLHDIGFYDEIEETHNTLEENAAEKALHIYNLFKINCFADDTGLEIEALHGEPGVYSARYASESCSFNDNINKVLEKMRDISNRNAKFRTVIALMENGNIKFFEGEIKGEILNERHGNKGFGYDPIFKPEGFDISFAEMAIDKKNEISHRAIAINKLAKHLSNI